MPRTLLPQFQSHLQEPTTELAFAIRIERSDGLVQGFTSHVEDVEIDGLTYLASSAITPSSIEEQVSTGVSNTEFLGVISSETITEEDCLAGAYDHARCLIFAYVYSDLAKGICPLVGGRLGEVSLNGSGGFSSEIRSKLQLATQRIGDLLSATCRVLRFGDGSSAQHPCNPPGGKAAYRWTGTVTGVTDRREFSADLAPSTPADGYFDLGELNWLTGDNAGMPTPDVMAYASTGAAFELMSAMRKDISVGDTFEVFAGCDRRVETCADKFDNVLNFQGEPHVPGPDYVVQIIGGGR